MQPTQQMLCSFGNSAATDPYWANVVSLLHFDGADGSTTFTDQKGKTWTAHGNAQLDTAQFKFGTASLLCDGTGDWIDTPDHADWDFGSGDFTIEWQLRPNSTASVAHVLAHINAGGFGWTVLRNGTGMEFYASSNGTTWDIASAKVIGTVGTGAWYYGAISRVGSNWYTFKNDGTQGSTWTSSAALFNNTTAISIGGAYNGSTSVNGWVDECRFTKGVGRYNANFTPPSAEFPNS